MTFGNENQGMPYRQMELNPNIADGEQHSPAQMMRRAEDARQAADYYAKQQQILENTNRAKEGLSRAVDELGMLLRTAVVRLEQEEQSMLREVKHIDATCNAFKLHLQKLTAMKPYEWSPEAMDDRLKEAEHILSVAANDFEEAYRKSNHFYHTQIFRYKPGAEEETRTLSWPKFKRLMLKGLAFHLPLFVLLLISWAVWAIISSF